MLNRVNEIIKVTAKEAGLTSLDLSFKYQANAGPSPEDYDCYRRIKELPLPTYPHMGTVMMDE